ncbi:MAG: hypothetical protein EOO14_00765 [Chitinophagaceae bacterium]|nr:MAG: hypothetical protein EOO14_00765 [Chitinophagaceae bacterium]
MAYRNLSDNTGRTFIMFSDIFGGGWSDDVLAVIKQHLQPHKVEEKLQTASWHSSESEILFSLQQLEFRVHFNVDDSISLEQVSGKPDHAELTRCADIIDRETQKLNTTR